MSDRNEDIQNIKIGDRIGQLRKQAGLKQEELGDSESCTDAGGTVA